MSYIYDQGKLPSKEIAPGVTMRPMWGERIHMSIIDFAPHSEVPMHSHPHEQCGRVLKGEFEFTIGGETRTVREGDFYVIPGGVEHAAKAGKYPAQALDIFSPPREEYMITE